MATTPSDHDTQRPQESKKTDEKEEAPAPTDENKELEAYKRKWCRSHTAFEQIHAEMAEIAGLARAAYDALLELPRFELPEGRREIRTVTALVRATCNTSTESLRKWDRWIDDFEKRSYYYDGSEADDFEAV